MNNWTNEFLNRCLDIVPNGSYRRRAEQELRDHLLALSQDLEEAGHAPEEAHALAQERMGDPAELARRYLREWRRRTLGQRILRRILTTAEVLLVGTVMVVMSYLYIINTNNFGKELPAFWAYVAIPAAVILLGSSLIGSWTLAQLSSWIIAVIQLPPILLWTLYLDGAFDMSGLAVYGWMGLSLHLLYFAWGIVNYYIAVHFERVESILSKAQSA